MKNDCLPNYISVSFRTNEVYLRDIIDLVSKLTIVKMKYVVPEESDDIRAILEKEVAKYRIKFLACLVVLIPILVLVWIVPYTSPEFLTYAVVVNGIPAYIFLLLFFSSIIQFAFGSSFYVGAYKSVKHGGANMDVLVVLGTTAAWFYGVLTIFIGYGSHYDQEDESMKIHAVHEHGHNFEISATLITVILLGKWMESFSKKQTVDKLSELASLKVTKASMIYERGSNEAE